MKRVTSLLMMIVIIVSMTACGSSVPAPAPAEGQSNPSASTPDGSYSEPIEESEPDIIEPQPEPSDEPVPVEGLIAMYVTKGAHFKYNNITRQETTVILTSIDTQTGAVQDVRTFTNANTRDFTIEIDLSMNPSTPPIYLQRFDESFDRMVASRRMPDGAEHVGFVDGNGVFTDVSALVTVPAGDFGGLTKHAYPRFGPDGYFYYMDESDGGRALYRVHIDAMTPDAIELINEHLSVPSYFIQPDGSVIDAVFLYYCSPSMTHRAPEFITDWVDDTTYVGGGYKSDLIYKYTALTNEEWKNNKGAAVYAYADRTALVPDINNRSNYHAVISPDQKTVAFLSRLTSGADQSPYLFTVPLDGGDPVKIDAPYTFYAQSNDSLTHSVLLAWVPSGS